MVIRNGVSLQSILGIARSYHSYIMMMYSFIDYVISGWSHDNNSGISFVIMTCIHISIIYYVVMRVYCMASTHRHRLSCISMYPLIYVHMYMYVCVYVCLDSVCNGLITLSLFTGNYKYDQPPLMLSYRIISDHIGDHASFSFFSLVNRHAHD